MGGRERERGREGKEYDRNGAKERSNIALTNLANLLVSRRDTMNILSTAYCSLAVFLASAYV